MGLTMAANAQVNSSPTEIINKKRKCGSEIPPPEWNAEFSKQVATYKADMMSSKTATANYTISVIFHIISGAQAVGVYPNLSQAQINSQITVLNNDFAGAGANMNVLTATAFSAVGAANCGVTFCLAKKNEHGQTLAEPGIDRVSYIAKGWLNPNSYSSNATLKTFVDGTVKPNTIWDVNRYLNIWTTDVNPSVLLLGYATFPLNAALVGLPGGGTSTTDGVWLASLCTGSINVGSYKGRTCSHEVGHWLGLRHIGGDAAPDGDCLADDYCADTPPQRGTLNENGQNYGCGPYPLNATGSRSCSAAPNGSMYMNFMDYSDDNCVCMFTPDQKTRVQVALSPQPNGGFYRSLLTQAATTLCNNPSAAPITLVTVPNIICDTAAVCTTTDNFTTGNPIPTYSWSSSPSAGVTFSPNSISAAPSISFASTGVYTITCAATNSVGTNSAVTTVSVNGCAIGIAKHSLLKTYISLQPNPSSGKVSLITSLPSSQTLEVSVRNALGQLMISSKHKDVTNSSIELDLTTYSAGVYFVTIANGSEKLVKRLILNK